MNIDIIAGARPNFVKIAPIIVAIEKAKSEGFNIECRLIHTGQHYDNLMSGSFFQQLNIPQPYVNLNAGGGTQAQQTAAIILAYEKLLSEDKPDLTLVVGDVTSTMACALVAKKEGVQLAHVEAGIRSGDRLMPEEINRIVTDSITDFFFTTTKRAGENLIKSGVDPQNVFFVGNVMIDTLVKHENDLVPPVFWHKLSLEQKKYFVLTLHRPSNVDNKAGFIEILTGIAKKTIGIPVVFPVHPRSVEKAKEIVGADQELFVNINLTDPLGYLEFNYLIKNAMGIITDSGGITEEATAYQVPCITVRNTTERPETVEMGTNELVGTNMEAMGNAIDNIIAGRGKRGKMPEKWDGMAAARIVKVLLSVKQDFVWE